MGNCFSKIFKCFVFIEHYSDIFLLTNSCDMPYPIIYDWSKPCFIQFSGLKPIVNWVASVFPFALHLFLFRSEFQIVDLQL